MKRIVLLIFAFSTHTFASTTAVNVPVKGAVTSATCTFTADAEVDFGAITALAINNNTVPEKDINMSVNCDWTATNLKLTFIPRDTVSGDDKTMKSGLAGVGFKLPTMGSIRNLSFNTEHIWSTTGIPGGGTRDMPVKIKPVKVPSEDIAAGNINTTLTIRLSYD
ncbi:fimbrial protein [Salmonella enterica subsp. enterica serovar Denver]|uniref:Fimbrial protein n=1 Tax=Salmonella enterica subsp. enterica serovar Denver TaxID=1954177 RepID=A0A657FWZ3_SALET|nr:fimbrial protein [Salmonella enterica subsp. enterica]EGI5872759.1 fimbrial protein [Salmonella enterica subsp. enterica serovar Denver]MKC77392.1 fimbrial protein [Salmonella enterica subsp. enterica serovar Denver]